jgi:hypothetical protein
LSRCQAEERPLVGARSASSVARVATASTSSAQCRLLVATAASSRASHLASSGQPRRQDSDDGPFHGSGEEPGVIRSVAQNELHEGTEPCQGPSADGCRYEPGVPGLAPQSCVVIRAWTRPLAGGPPQTAIVLFGSCCSASRAICAPGLRRSPWAAGYGEFRRRYLWRSEELADAWRAESCSERTNAQ